jgi:hypothetical protein
VPPLDAVPKRGLEAGVLVPPLVLLAAPPKREDVEAPEVLAPPNKLGLFSELPAPGGLKLNAMA